MYIPTSFQESELHFLHETMRATRLANLVIATADGPVASPLPLLLDDTEGPHGVLYGHVSRANPQWRQAVLGEALAIFMGPDAYVSPSFYPSKQQTGKVVPTWNYIAVHAYGPIEFFHDAERLLRLVTRLTDMHEGRRAQPWAVSDAPADYIASQLKGIVGFRLPISRLEGKRKMSQNRSAEDRAGVAAGLAGSPDAMEKIVARLIPD
ncbi:MAG: FMN-binding negative transcriptional regulator [Noviherbaspirillum sp.]